MPITMKWGTPINFTAAGGNPVIMAGGNPVIMAGGNPVITAVETLLLWQVETLLTAVKTLLLWQVFFMLWGLLSLHSYPMQMEISSPFQNFQLSCAFNSITLPQFDHKTLSFSKKKPPHITVSSFLKFFFLVDTSFLIAESCQLCGRHPIISWKCPSLCNLHPPPPTHLIRCQLTSLNLLVSTCSSLLMMVGR